MVPTDLSESPVVEHYYLICTLYITQPVSNNQHRVTCGRREGEEEREELRQPRKGDDDYSQSVYHSSPYCGRLYPRPPAPVPLSVHQEHLWPCPGSAHEDS